MPFFIFYFLHFLYRSFLSSHTLTFSFLFNYLPNSLHYSSLYSITFFFSALLSYFSDFTSFLYYSLLSSYTITISFLLNHLHLLYTTLPSMCSVTFSLICFTFFFILFLFSPYHYVPLF